MFIFEINSFKAPYGSVFKPVVSVHFTVLRIDH